jgi:hypothetical protein
MARQFATTLVALSLAACSGEVIPGTTGGDTVSGADSGAGGSTGSGGIGDGGAGGSGGSGACVPVEETGGFQQATCADLDRMTVSDPVVTDAGGDGKLSPGEAGKLALKLNEISGKGFNWYPGVKFYSDVPGVFVKELDWYYAILPCQSFDTGATILVDTPVPKGTLVHVTAQVAMLNTECPDAFSITVPVEIE